MTLDQPTAEMAAPSCIAADGLVRSGAAITEGKYLDALAWHVAPQPVTRPLREQFGLNFVDAAKGIAHARRLHQEAANG